MKDGNQDAFDVVVIGSGTAGLAAARGAARRGLRVAVVERDVYLGGDCPNYACVPTKTLLRSASVYTLAEHADEFGLRVGEVSVAYAELKRHKDHVVAHTGARHTTSESLHAEGITLVRGQARFVDQHTLLVGRTRLTARQVVIATGSGPRIPKLEGLDSVRYLTSRTAVGLTTQPTSVIILGAGPIGVEFAQVFAAFGSDVTLLEQTERILGREEPETAEVIAQSLRGYGVQIVTGVTAESVRRSDQGVTLSAKQRDQVHTFHAHHLFLAAGQQPNLDGLGLETLGVDLDEGRLTLDETLRTSLPHIWAAGDVVGSTQYTHAAHAMGSLVAHNLVEPQKRLLNFRVLPRVTFTHLELASVGQTEAELVARGIEVVTGLAPIGSLSRSLTDGEPSGLVKIVADATSGEILGASIACVRAGEMIHELALAMQLRATIRDITQTVHAFPTYSEAIALAAHAALQKLITS